ncbi:KUP/HAK/KT family potassium transporter [Geobacter sulfurreducens]|jgi:KUP system potassium uptake protein|uniref:Probable potassium transport system protein Kup 2 n=1 Tax=Geobacter sulfurreducens (strain ATCC 51573 / DSM 12127 / PCA) TaxID=243231 RepID=KUP2_GEOSL|nr:KUP/HAK/KT family potassium transporter [Geobacter sulfurreducens]Q74AA5.1 RecName: Full=Probable potassium transport system protein Kup 2 [Geobacter sulfurreducens PCA]AAR35858.1 Kup system potassium transporter [Geobacter sulfurreducens PCA]AJY68723.1 potassium transporter Kup [Geobacter sulfurreducens]QVW34315.1 KUP/HAK/KT family potassium transporter [Geobacter sulfurreducens]UAC03186.1 KUP/HAK/KT family potassium transporter [Geobacter sulfurreducens]UTG91840.1 KUP/HAK/KT family potas
MKTEAQSYWGGIIKSMGLVFGDIGTSPIYTLTVIMTLTKPDAEHVLGILSLIVWTLIILVTVEYAWLAMSLGRKGEGGTIVLKEILIRLLKSGRQMAFAGFLAFLGVSLLLGDGVITPAISILSAVEGMRLIPGLEDLAQGGLILVAAVIAVFLFIFQFKGTDKVASAFGPIMVVWFSALTVSGLVSIIGTPTVVQAISPHHAVLFLKHNGLAGFFVLSEVILCATGGEALYADMGHLGRKPIIRAWYFVFCALVINYLGQGAFILRNPEAKNILFSMVKSQVPMLYIPFLLLTISATIIASQALISGVFSIVYQGITTRILPLMKVDYTSTHLKSQIYIGSVNWSLLVAVIFIMILFQRSENLAAAYGLAVTGTMFITGIMMTMIFSRTTKKWKVPIALAVTVIDFAYLTANLHKLPHGGYWSLVLASIPLAIMVIWTRGQRALYRSLKPLDLDTFLLSYEQIYAKGHNIPGTGLFFVRETPVVPPYVIHCIIRSNIIYERNVFVSLTRTDEPFDVRTKLTRGIGTGLDAFEVNAGYMERLDIEKLLKKHGVEEKVIFYGIEDIDTSNPVWRIFATIKRQSANFVQFNKLPVSKLQGVVTRVEM